MKRGFMDFVATRIIPDYPGHTASWYAYEYLQLGDDLDLSDAKHPEQSLANTLSKQVKTGREKRVRRERIKGVYCFFPVSGSSTSNSRNSSVDIFVQFSLSPQELEDIDNLVAVDKFANRNSAMNWLVIEGIKANRNYLNKAAEVKRQIDKLKKEI